MTDEPNPARCEPPKELRGVLGHHYVTNGNPACSGWVVEWFPAENESLRPIWADGLCGGLQSATPEELYHRGYRYLAPVTPPAEVSALREQAAENYNRMMVEVDRHLAAVVREAALRVEVERLREALAPLYKADQLRRLGYKPWRQWCDLEPKLEAACDIARAALGDTA
jgi:hypothetical protein